ncbi:MAG TPA: LysR family transcriptional regulator, partial [Paraburkholderia sp.]|nr:LysR family transcriptional regulator [Paraburkholderia sp.]
ISMWSDFVFYGMSGPLVLRHDALHTLPIRDELPDFHVFMVYRSTDLMTQACTEFSKEIRHRCRTKVPPRAAAPGATRARKTAAGAPK